jgi:hypothetical protein
MKGAPEIILVDFLLHFVLEMKRKEEGSSSDNSG